MLIRTGRTKLEPNIHTMSVNMVLERHIVWYSEYNNFFPSSKCLHISIRRVYFTTCFGRKGHNQIIYIRSSYINFVLLFFATPPSLANVYINGGGGCCLLFGVCFYQ
jgi:hypothetical protein